MTSSHAAYFKWTPPVDGLDAGMEALLVPLGLTATVSGIPAKVLVIGAHCAYKV